MDFRDMVYYRSAVWDGNNLAWRYMRKPFLTFSHKGRKTGVIHGVLSSILALKRRYKTRDVYVCWDNAINKRKAVSESYKANRVKCRYQDTNELGKQIETLHNNLSRFGVLSLQTEGYEADDLCYSVTKKVSKTLDGDGRIMLISRDHDFRQIIDSVGADKACLLIPGSGKQSDVIIDEPLGYSFVVFHALTGDVADNIKGIFRFSKEKALELATKYETVEALLKGESGDEKIQENKETLSQNAVLLKSIEYPGIDVQIPKPNFDAVREFCEVFGLNKIMTTYYGVDSQPEITGGLV